MERLAQRGAKLDVPSNRGESPLDLAKKKGYQETVARLENA